MRLRQLNLTRYGHFTDFSLDFGEKSTKDSDFHIIFGENEAGKSTTFNGYLDLLFGIEERTKYSFKHDNRALRIDALLEINGTLVELSRIKKRSESLLDIQNQPLNEKVITSALHGLSRESYRMMFSLDDETIQLGGEEILASNGDFGRLLFSGTAGLTDLNKKLESIKEQANTIYSEQSRTFELNTLLQTLKQLKEEQKNLDTQVSAYERLAEIRSQTEDAYKKAKNEREFLHKEQRRLLILKDALGIYNSLKKFESEIAPIIHLPDVPITWTEEVRNLQKKMAVAKGNQEDANADIINNKNTLEKLPTNPLILGLHKEIEEIATLAIFSKAAHQSLPKLHLDLSKMEHAFEEIRQRLGINQTNELTDFLISDDILAHLDRLVQDATPLMQKLNSAKQEDAEAKITLSQLHEDGENTAQPDVKIIELIALYDRYIEDDIQMRLDVSKKTLSNIKQRMQRKLEKIHWTKYSGNMFQDLPSLNQAKRWHEKVRELKEELFSKKAQQTQCMEEKAALDGKVKSLLAQLDGISDDHATKVREKRVKAWTAHLTTLNKESATIFEKLLAEDDLIQKERAIATDRLSQFRIEESNLFAINSKLHFISDVINRLEKDLKHIHDEVIPIFLKIGLSEKFKIEDLPRWLDAAQEVYDLQMEEDTCRTEVEEVNAEYNQRKTKLLGLLTQFHPKLSETLDLKELCEIAKSYRNETFQNKARYDQVKKTIKEAEIKAKRREKNLYDAEAQFKQWQSDWFKAIDGYWFNEMNVDQIKALLPSLRNLAMLMAKQKILIKEISAQETHLNNFNKSISQLIHTLGLEKSNDLAMQFSNIQKKFKEAQDIENLREGTTKNNEQAQLRLIKAEKELSNIKKRLQEMTSYFPSHEVSTLDQMILILEQVKKKNELMHIIADKQKDLLEHLSVKTMADAEELLNDAMTKDFDKNLVEINENYQEADKEFEKRVTERHEANREIEAIGGDASVTRLNEKYQSVLLEIAQKTDRALSLHFGLMTADLALAAYRDRHRSDLLKQTADIFSAITEGHYKSLATQLNQSKDLLVAMRPDGRSITVDKMSKGTSFQMYLALRLAAYDWICKKEGPLPFIGDDIMETFDDKRVEASIRQFSEVAKNGQVIYFTHHRHVCEIAKKVCGDSVKIHEIPKRLVTN